MNYETEYNQRQYRLMAQTLAEYANGATGLLNLIGNLNFLANALIAPDPVWIDHFQHQCNVLDEVYAVAIDLGQKRFTDNDLGLIHAAVRELQALVTEKIAPE